MILSQNIFLYQLSWEFLAVMVAMVVGIPLGMISALKQNTYIDYSCMFFALLGVSVPAMTLGPVLVWFFCSKTTSPAGSTLGNLATGHSSCIYFGDWKRRTFSSLNQGKHASGN